MESQTQPKNILVNAKFPSERVYDVAWALTKLEGFQSLDDFITDTVLKKLEMYPEGSAGIDMKDWGFKSRWQIQREKEKEEEQLR